MAIGDFVLRKDGSAMLGSDGAGMVFGLNTPERYVDTSCLKGVELAIQVILSFSSDSGNNDESAVLDVDLSDFPIGWTAGTFRTGVSPNYRFHAYVKGVFPECFYRQYYLRRTASGGGYYSDYSNGDFEACNLVSGYIGARVRDTFNPSPPWSRYFISARLQTIHKIYSTARFGFYSSWPGTYSYGSAGSVSSLKFI